MVNTRLTNPIKVSSNTDPAPSNVVRTPSNGSDGNYTWNCVGQKDTGATSTITFSVLGMANTPTIVAGTTNQVTTNCSNKGAATNYIQVTATYVAPSNTQNWTIIIGSTGNGNVRFTRGAGGGAVRKPAPAKKTAVKKAAKPAKKAAKPVKKAAKPAKKAAPKAAKRKVAAKRRK